jgi:amino acid transporter
MSLATELPQTEAPLVRRFGLLQATALNMSNMIGVGPFITIPTLMAVMGGPQAMLGWIVALIIALADGLVWSELGAAMPGSGGSYGYLRDGFGPRRFGRFMAFLFIWQFLFSAPLEIASGYIGFAQHVGFLWPKMTPFHSQLVKIAIGIFTIALLYRRITSVGKITVTLWFGTLLTVGIIVISGPFHFNPKLAFDFPPNAFNFSLGFFLGLGAAARIGMYDYLGYYDVCFIGDEVKDPGRVIPRSILISLIAVAVIYFTMNLSMIGVVSWREVVRQPMPDPPPAIASMFIERLYGPKAANVFTLMILWTALASCFALMLGWSRVPYAAARDGNFFSVFARVHPTRQFPHISLLAIGGLSIVCSFLNLAWVIDALLTTRIVVVFIGQIGAVLWLRKNAPNLQRPFRIWLYPLPILVALFGWLFLLFTTDRKLLGFGGAVLALGVIGFFLFFRKLSPSKPG